MTTLTFEKNIKIDKKIFIDLKDLYSYLLENQEITEVGELSEDEINSNMKNNFENAKKLDNHLFINLK